MKKYFTYIIIAAATVFAASCAEEQVGVDNSDATVTLRLQTSEMETRATVTETGNVIPGVGVENTLTHADFFFFSDSEGQNLISHVHLNVGTNAANDLVAAGTNIYEHKFDVSDEGNPLQNASYVYVIANYPSEITKTTLADILDLDINIDLSGTLTAFVMDSYDSATESHLTYLSPSKTADSKTFTIGLKRAAAKLELNFNVINEFEDAAENVWTPVFGPMWVNFLNARKVGKVAAEPVAFDEKTNYFSTAQYAPTKVTPAAKEGYTSWTIPAVYTYPQQYQTSDVTAPYYKIFIPWVCEKKGQNNFYYKIILPELGSFKRNKIYKLTVDVSVIGGTEDDWALVTDHIYVADWWAPEKIESSVEGAMYLDVPVKHYDIYGIDYVDVPVVSSNNIQIVSTTGTKQNLYGTNGNGVPYDVTVTPTVTVGADGKSSFRLTHVLDNNMYTMSGNNRVRNPNFDCTPINYTVVIKHTEGGLSKTVTVTITQYPPIYAQRDPSNGYAYVNSYASGRNRGGRYSNGNAYNNSGNNNTRSLATLNTGNASNANYNQYVISVSVLPTDYRVEGMSNDVIIGDPRGGKLTYNYLGFEAGTNGDRDLTVQDNFKAVSTTTQHIIAPAIRIASSWGATSQMTDYNRAEERCAAYQENGYPAGRWRIPTVAEIDFLIQLSTFHHIPDLFTTERLGTRYYRGYWSNGPSVYVGNSYVSGDGGHPSPYVIADDYDQTTYNYQSVIQIDNERFLPGIRCVYDEWYWGSAKYGNNGQVSNTAATQWLGYIF